MSWALNVDARADLKTVTLFTESAKTETAPIELLINRGLPESRSRSRMPYLGDLSQWNMTDSGSYLHAYGVALGGLYPNQHFVYECVVGRVRIVVPALVFLRALFKPSQEVLPVLFTPGTVDVLSFVDFSFSPTRVVVDDSNCNQKFKASKLGGRRHLSLEWSQKSRSARASAQSIFTHALKGALGVQLPQGQASLIFHGIKTKSGFFVNQATFVSMAISKEDSIDDSAHIFLFHAMADKSRQKTASVCDFRVPLHHHGGWVISDTEWIVVADLLKGLHASRLKYSQRHLADGVLFKLATRTPWSQVPYKCGGRENHIAAFRAWTVAGRLQAVLAYLEKVR